MKRPFAVLSVCLLLAAGLVPAQQPAKFLSGADILRIMGHPPETRMLIIHADDLGMSHSVNRATMEAFKNGWISSASIMVPCPWFPEIARWQKEHPGGDLGIHLVLNAEWATYRWGPISADGAVPTLVDPLGYFPLTEVEVAQHASPAEVERELRAQIKKAQEAGIKLSHLDSHMGTLFRRPALFDVYVKLGREFGLPVLITYTAGKTLPPGMQIPDGAIVLDSVVQLHPGIPKDKWIEEYKRMLTTVTPGVHQLIVHLGFDDEELRAVTFEHPNWGSEWRQNDFDLVKNEEFQKFLKEQKFVVTTWGEIAKAVSGQPSAVR